MILSYQRSQVLLTLWFILLLTSQEQNYEPTIFLNEWWVYFNTLHLIEYSQPKAS